MTDPPRRMSREARREMLIDATGRLLGSRDVPVLTFEAVADEAGVSKTLPYKYFESPDAIADELYERVVVDGVDRLTVALVAGDATFDDKIAGGFNLWCDVIKTHGYLLLALVDRRSIPSLRPRIDARRLEAARLWASLIAEEFDVDDDAANVIATSITAASTALLLRWVRERGSRRATTDSFVRLVRAQCEAFERSSTAV